MTIQRIDHLNIVTPALDSTCQFLSEVFGLTIGTRPGFESVGRWLYQDGHAFFHVQTAERPVGSSHASALNHVAFLVSDFDALLARLSRMRVEAHVRPIAGSARRQAFFDDPNGVRLEVQEP